MQPRVLLVRFRISVFVIQIITVGISYLWVEKLSTVGKYLPSVSNEL